jgi:hypothetical protein
LSVGDRVLIPQATSDFWCTRRTLGGSDFRGWPVVTPLTFFWGAEVFARDSPLGFANSPNGLNGHCLATIVVEVENFVFSAGFVYNDGVSSYSWRNRKNRRHEDYLNMYKIYVN